MELLLSIIILDNPIRKDERLKDPKKILNPEFLIKNSISHPPSDSNSYTNSNFKIQKFNNEKKMLFGSTKKTPKIVEK